MKANIATVCFFSVLLVLFACSKKAGTDSIEVQKQFTVQGIVVEIEDEGRTIVIDHEEMPGYMGAMTMPFRAKNPDETTNLEPGDQIQFTYKVAELSSWIEEISPTGIKVEIDTDPPAVNPSSKLLKEGDPFPDFELISQDDEPVRLKDYRGSVVALTFIFTRCPVPEYCPAMMRNFHEVENLLKTGGDDYENYQLLTVSFDSDFDTPEVLKSYGEQFGQKSDSWNLLTSRNQDDVKSIGEAVGLMFGKTETAIYSHNLRTVVIDGGGIITKIFTDETWKPNDLVNALKAAANR